MSHSHANNSCERRKESLNCEICKLTVETDGQHYAKTKNRPDGYWTCHKHVGKARCAKCGHIWPPKTNPFKLPSRCPSCGEDCDLFWADDGGWEKPGLTNKRNDFDFIDDEL